MKISTSGLRWVGREVMKNYKTIVLVLVLVGLFATVLGTQAANEKRYLVKSDSAFWKNTFNSRHVFDKGFSANLSDWQLRLAKVFNVEVEPIQILQVLPEKVGMPNFGPSLDIPGISKSGRGKPIKPSAPSKERVKPNDQTPWGIEEIYGDSEIEYTSGGKDVTVAILDTGINKDHLDLVRRITQCKDFTHPRAVVREGKCDDLNGHGTHVSGIIGADGGEDGLGIYGVAPEVSLWAYRVCDVGGSCWADDIAGAIRMAADQSVNIINLSIGSDVEIHMVTDAMNYAREKGTLVIVAAGNDGPNHGSIDYPAAHEYAVSVGAFNSLYEVPEWSSRGINSETKAFIKEAGDVEFAAPGVEIESTWKDGGYSVISGTSMATPYISGLIAKMWQGGEDAATSTRNALQLMANNIWGGDGDATGFGFPVVPDESVVVK